MIAIPTPLPARTPVIRGRVDDFVRPEPTPGSSGGMRKPTVLVVSIAAWSIAAWSIAACGSPTTEHHGGDGGTGDGCDPGCAANQVCSENACTDLPASCPCPSGAYCNLATNTCNAGCAVNDDCSANQFCNAQHQCSEGCRDDSGCAARECATATCNAGTCQYENMANGTACSTDSNPCTSDVCSAGSCGHAVVPDWTPCYPNSSGSTYLKKACVTGVCQASYQTCTGVHSSSDTLAIVWAEPSNVEGVEGTSCTCGTGGTKLTVDGAIDSTGNPVSFACSACGTYTYDTDYYYTYCLP